MHGKPFIALGALLVNLLPAGTAHGVGFGAELGVGTASWEYDYGARENRYLLRESAVFDTRLTGSWLINYRGTLGYEANIRRDGDGLNMSGETMSHSLGFRISSGERYRLWIGPQIVLTSYRMLSDGTSTRYKGYVQGTGWGAVMGYNMQIKSRVTVGFTGGVRTMNYTARYDASRDNGAYRGSADTRVDSVAGFFDVSVLFHVRERGN